MTDGALTRPERAAQIRQAKRYKAAIEKRGLCSACKHRDPETYFGVSVCSVGQQRRYPQCETDGKATRFEFDDTVLAQFQDK